MNCPICNVPLQIAQRQDIEIDFCPKCRGVWLDRGELDKIIERSVAPQQGQPYQQQPGYAPTQHYDKQYDDHYSGHHKKRGFLQDLFD
jgi:Zn-finger nucleic acid-binding protein